MALSVSVIVTKRRKVNKSVIVSVAWESKSDHKRFVHFLTCCGAFPVRPERSAAKSKATGPAPSLLFDCAAGAATLRAYGLCVLKACAPVPMSFGSI